MKERVVKSRSTQDIEKLINKMTQGKTYGLRNWAEKRDIDAENSTVSDLANAFCTLVNDLKGKGIIQK